MSDVSRLLQMQESVLSRESGLLGEAVIHRLQQLHSNVLVGGPSLLSIANEPRKTLGDPPADVFRRSHGHSAPSLRPLYAGCVECPRPRICCSGQDDGRGRHAFSGASDGRGGVGDYPLHVTIAFVPVHPDS